MLASLVTHVVAAMMLDDSLRFSSGRQAGSSRQGSDAAQTQRAWLLRRWTVVTTSSEAMQRFLRLVDSNEREGTRGAVTYAELPLYARLLYGSILATWSSMIIINLLHVHSSKVRT